MDYVLENGEKPKSVYLAKLNGFTEADFMTFRHYRKFRKEIFKIFLERQSNYFIKTTTTQDMT
jgi:hypothetical protein